MYLHMPYFPKSTVRSLDEAQSAEGGGAVGAPRLVSVGPSAHFCVREFQRFLGRVDGDQRWGGLSARVTQGGQVVFACPDCCGC